MKTLILRFLIIVLCLSFSTVLFACNDDGTEPIEQENPYPLCNPDATDATKAVYEYICSMGGKGCLSGQQESTWMTSPEYEMEYLFENTGKYPAIRGLDYINDDFDGVNERAVEWWQKGGIVTICWHTGADFSSGYEESKNNGLEDWNAALTEGTDEYNALISGMDKGAAALLELKEAGVPVLWRPFHEFDGTWFWWSQSSAKNFVKLWRIMYERYTNHWKLNNLIWVAGYSHFPFDKTVHYPGDEYCDAIGADSYEAFSPYLYNKVDAVTKKPKPRCYHECGLNPTVEELKAVPWVWFMTWHTNYLIDENNTDDLSALYNDDYIITLDELPDFT